MKRLFSIAVVAALSALAWATPPPALAVANPSIGPLDVQTTTLVINERATFGTEQGIIKPAPEVAAFRDFAVMDVFAIESQAQIAGKPMIGDPGTRSTLKPEDGDGGIVALGTSAKPLPRPEGYITASIWQTEGIDTSIDRQVSKMQHFAAIKFGSAVVYRT